MTKKKSQNPTRIVTKGTSSLKTAAVHTLGSVAPTAKSPDQSLHELFDAVQRQRVFPDGKTFVDLVPAARASAIIKAYRQQCNRPDFDLAKFVRINFASMRVPNTGYTPSVDTTARQHVTQLWSVLRRRNRKNRGSLVALPYQYITPGGRFAEQFYWDTYFIMLGLAADGQWGVIYDMMRNYTFMLRKFGMIPTANRTYFLSRSQPPFFAHMVQLLASHRGQVRTHAEFLPSLLIEYRFWMRGQKTAAKNTEYPAHARVVIMPDGSVLNRYYDNLTTPRPESHHEDVVTAEQAASANKNRIFLDLRAGAESGWDFSSRWFNDPYDIQTIETTGYVPVDLNCLLYQLEQTIAAAYDKLLQRNLANRFRRAAERRADAIRRYHWSGISNFFEDYEIARGELSGKLTLAGVFPLYAGIATPDQAKLVAERIERDFLKPGGLVSTLVDNGQQWDAPNGWAPLQWVAIVGLRNYGYDDLARVIRDRWLALNEKVFSESRKMVEKYDVVNAGAGGGGEYPLQDGFGWTNGVYAVLHDEKERENEQ